MLFQINDISLFYFRTNSLWFKAKLLCSKRHPIQYSTDAFGWPINNKQNEILSTNSSKLSHQFVVQMESEFCKIFYLFWKCSLNNVITNFLMFHPILPNMHLPLAWNTCCYTSSYKREHAFLFQLWYYWILLCSLKWILNQYKHKNQLDEQGFLQ